MTFEEFKAARAKLSAKQQKWVEGKCKWERMTQWAVMNNWTVPPDKNLNRDGTWKGK